jgi:hypothetical protein
MLAGAESSFYFSSVTYATIGYGDLVLPERVAVVRPQWKVDGHFDVRVVYCISIRYFEQTVRRQNENQPKLIHKALHYLVIGLHSDPAEQVAEVEVCRNFAVIARRNSSAGSFPAVPKAPGPG